MLSVRVRFFAQMADDARMPTASFSVSEGTTLADLKGTIIERFPALRWPAGTMLAVNQEYASLEQGLREGDEIAVIPPVSGG